jgi:hypothetical protein
VRANVFVGFGLILFLVISACLLPSKPAVVDLEQGKALIVGNCAFHWRRSGGERADKLEVTIEELISGQIYKAYTDSEGFYIIPNVIPGIYILKLIRFRYQDIRVEHYPLVKLFVINPGKVFYLGRFVVEMDTADLRREEEYPCYEKYVAGDLTAEELEKILSSHNEGQKWTKIEMVLENPLEKF